MTRTMIADEAPATQRRIWAVAPYLGYGLTAAAFWAVDTLDGTAEVVTAVIAAVAAVLTLVSAYAVYSWRREWAHRPDEELDEMQRSARNRAYRSAYATLATIGALAIVGAQILLDLADDLSITAISSVVVLGWFLLALCLPSSVLLWREEDLDLSDAVAGGQ